MTDRGDLTGRIALVTGAAGEIGAACTQHLAGSGATVVGTDLPAALEGAHRLPGVEYMPVDVTDSGQVRSSTADVLRTFGRLDVSVNVAGISGRPERLHTYDDDDWLRVMEVNLNGVFRCLREQVTAMLPTGGSIITVSSVTGHTGFATASAYSASKHGLEGLTRTAALEYARDGIRINSVAPGFIETELLTARRPRDVVGALAAAHPVGRLGTPAEVAEVVTFLASDRASFVTGACYSVDGGFLAGPVSLGS